jgi:hypothetical protein
MKHVSNERGALPVLVIVLVALLVVVVGVAVYNGSKARNANTQTANGSPSPAGSPATSASPTATPANRFNVPELGFTMTLPSGLEGLKYSVIRDKNGTDFSATFSTDSLERADSASTCKAAQGPLGGISKYSYDPTGKTSGTPDIKKVDSFYLTHSAPQAACSLNDATAKLQTSQAGLLKQAFDSAEPL